MPPQASLARRRFLKMLAGGAVTLSGATLLAACSSSRTAAQTASSSSSTTAKAATSATTEASARATPEPTAIPVKAGQTLLQFWVPFNPHAADKSHWNAVAAMARDFHKAHPHIVVQLVTISYSNQMSEQLLTAIAAGQPPNSYYADRFLTATYAHKGIFTDLTPYNDKAGIAAKDYLTFTWNEVTWRGKQWALPFETDARLLWINNDTVQQSGLDPSKPPQTTTELLNWTDQLTKMNTAAGITQLGFWPAYAQGLPEVWLVDFGGHFWDAQQHKCTADTAPCDAAFTYIQGYAKRWGQGNVTKFFQSQPSGPVNNPFFTGRLAMTYNVSGALPLVTAYKPDLRFTLTPLPSPTGPGGSMAGGFSFTVPRQASHPDESYQWVQYGCGPEGSLIFCLATFTIPATKAALASTTYQQFLKNNEHFAQFVSILPKAWNRPVTIAAQDLWNALGKAQGQVMNLQLDPTPALQQVTQGVNAAYQLAIKG